MFLKIVQFYLPEFIKKKKLNELFCLTADAFQTVPPDLKGLSFSECLKEYALFTKKQAQMYMQNGRDTEEVKQRLYQYSYIYGINLRKNLRLTTRKKVIMVFKIIYKLIGIDLLYNGHGEIIINQCFFSKYYSKEVCMLISSLDEGLAAGLSGGGRLCFYQRITEGGSCCKACFKDGGN